MKEAGGKVGEFAVLIGASPITEELRRGFVRGGTPHAVSAAHLRGVRRHLVLGGSSFVALCVSLDEQARRRYAPTLPTLLSDLRALPGTVRSIGLIPAARGAGAAEADAWTRR